MNNMFFITQLIYVIEGKETVFNQFEDVVLPIIAQYNGQLLLRLKPTDDTFIESGIEKPYEIHLIAFAEEQDFENFMQDENRKQFLYLKEQSVKAALMIKGTQLQ